MEPYYQEPEPLRETFQRNRLALGLNVKKPNRKASQKFLVQYSDGSYSNMMTNYVMHHFDPVFDPSGQHLVPDNLKHHRLVRDINHTTAATILPLQPNQHPHNFHTPFIVDIPESWTKLNFSWSHDQFTANPPYVGVGSNMTLLQ